MPCPTCCLCELVNKYLVVIVTHVFTMQSTDTSTVVEMKEDMAVSIAGQRAPSPPPDPQQVYPLLSACGDSCGAAKESTNITSEELDKRLQDHLKCQATEW